MEKRKCFGTLEYQASICRGCPWYIECQNVENKLPKRKTIKLKSQYVMKKILFKNKKNSNKRYLEK